MGSERRPKEPKVREADVAVPRGRLDRRRRTGAGGAGVGQADEQLVGAAAGRRALRGAAGGDGEDVRLARRDPRKRWKRHDLEDLQQMYQAGTASPSTATSLSESTCHLCMRQFPAGEGRMWKLLGSVQDTRILCQPCDAQTPEPAAEGDGESTG